MANLGYLMAEYGSIRQRELLAEARREALIELARRRRRQGSSRLPRRRRRI